ncbi:MAG: GntR family transcriptional regulator [Anaerolineae bacterium]|nr:GntR family transcriptional regulator [Anaerolineae bacterium]
MLAWTLRGDSPAYQQIIEEVHRQVAEGFLRPGQPLLTVRDLARQLGLNPGTVARAYTELEREGCIVTRRGGGSLVADAPGLGRWLAERDSRLSGLAQEMVNHALSLGYRPEEIANAVSADLSHWQQQQETVGSAEGEAPYRIRFVGSHDLAVEILASQFRRAYPRAPFSVRYTGSVGGLMALLQGEANVAGSHLLDEESGEYNVPLVRRLLVGYPVRLITLVERWQGFIVAPGNPKKISRLEDLARSDVTFVNRQPGSGTRVLLDQRLNALGVSPSRVRGYAHTEETHLGVATVVAQGKADVGLGIRAAAHSLGLDFVPLLRERYDLVIRQEEAGASAIRAMLHLLSQQEFRRLVDGLGGYDTTKSGQDVPIDR